MVLEEEKEQSPFELEGETLPSKRKDTSTERIHYQDLSNKKKTKTSLDGVEMAITDLNKIAQATAVAPDDELDHFGKYVTASLKKLPLNALTCQEQIQSIINRARIAVVSKETPLGSLHVETSHSEFQHVDPSPKSFLYGSSSSSSTNFPELSPTNRSNIIQLAMNNAFQFE